MSHNARTFRSLQGYGPGLSQTASMLCWAQKPHNSLHRAVRGRDKILRSFDVSSDNHDCKRKTKGQLCFDR